MKRDTPWLLGVVLAYYVAAVWGMSLFNVQPSNITLLWLPSGISLVAFVHWGMRAFPYILVANFAATFPGLTESHPHYAYVFALINALADAVTPALGMLLLRRFLPDGLQAARDLAAFGIWGCVVPVSFSSLVLATNLVVGSYISWAEFPQMLRILFLADCLGVVLVYQIYAGWMIRSPVTRQQIPWIGVSVVAIVVALIMGFNGYPWAVFLFMPFVVVLAFEISAFLVAIVSSVSLVAIIAACASHAGPFAGMEGMNGHFELMAYAFATALTVLGISLQNTQLKRTENFSRQWQTAAELDPLTCLLNRRAFIPKLEYEHKRAGRTGVPYSLALLDIDYFKRINDMHGHASGDMILQGFSGLMKQSRRESDTIARYGGEEFVILLPECSAMQAAELMEELRYKLSETKWGVAEGGMVQVTVTIGVAEMNAFSHSDQEVLYNADKALYEAKQAGRNQIRIYQPEEVVCAVES